MTRVRAEGFTISLDGYGAGRHQDRRNPLGVGGTDLHRWLLPTRTIQRTLFGAEGGASDSSRGSTCAPWDTSAFSSLRRRKPPMSYSGVRGTMAPDDRSQRTARRAARTRGAAVHACHRLEERTS